MSTTGRSAKPALSFGLNAGLYDSIRPDYPKDAIDWLLPSNAQQVLDLGAGTGKLTSQLVARGLEVTAVDPSEPMLIQLRNGLPTVSTAIGSAEEIPVPDQTFDACLIAQAWHWVDPSVACLEIGRVLKPGGQLGIIWNTMDERIDWIADFLSIVEQYDTPGTDARRVQRIANPMIGEPFGQPEYFETTWTSMLTVNDLVSLASSRSYILTLPPEERQKVLDQVLEHATASAGLDGTLQFGYLTKCWRAVR